MSLSTRLSVTTALLLLVLSASAVQAQDAQTVMCRPCAIAQERCSVNCLGREGKAIGACLIGCDNAAAVCSCGETATLNSEDFVAKFGPQPGPRPGLKVVTAFSGACHSTTPCGSEYGSCANWSTFTSCGDPFCGAVFGCGECNEWGQCEAYGPGMKQFNESYRVCFNPQGQPCTEYQRSVSTGGCGC